MKTIINTFIAALVLALAATAAGAADYQGLAMSLAGAARSSGISRVLLGSFTAGAGAESEARYAQERAAAALASQKDLEVMDQETMQAYAGSKDGWMAKLPSRERPQAFIKGSVFQEGDDVTLLVKLVDARSGRVIRTGELKSRARFSGSDVPAVPDLKWDEPVAVAPVHDDFRDAPAEPAAGCEKSFKELTRVNTAAVDLKARYWARKMKEPGFTLGALSRNPGSEIRDPQVKEKFYALLSKYYDQAGGPALPKAQEQKLEAFMAKEDGVIDRCGSR